jgi:hypothetical protein
MLAGSTLDDLADDYAHRAAQEVLTLLARFCTPLGDSKDIALYDHVLQNVRSIVADGALQKVAAVLRYTAMPHVLLIHRDPAHVIRIACKDPLVRTGSFETQHERLFGKKCGILRQIQFSDSLQARLEACQRVVLSSRGTQGGSVKHVMRHFSFAPHRFESWTGPRRAYACCFHAVALLLAEMAGDSRRTPAERRQTEEALVAMSPQNLLEVGLAADFGEVSMRFLREFDKADRDPVRTAAELNAFAYTLQKLFVEGYILVRASQQGPDATLPSGPAASRGSGEPAAAPSAGGSDPAASRGSGEPAAAPSVGGPGPAASRGSGESAAAPTPGGSASQGVVDLEAKTLTQIVFEQLDDVVELRYGSKVHVVERRKQESMRRVDPANRTGRQRFSPASTCGLQRQ